MEALSKSGKVSIHLFSCVLLCYMVFLQVQMMNCQSLTNSIMPRSTLPFSIDISTTLQPGKVIKIAGFVEKSIKWLHLNLCPGPCGGENVRTLHLSIRFNEKKVIRTNFQNGNWGEESEEDIGGPFPFTTDAKFLLLIEVQSDGYQVTGNGVKLFKLAHRLPYSDVTTLNMNSHPYGQEARIEKIEIIDTANQIKPGKVQVIYPFQLATPVRNPTIPVWVQFPEGLRIGQIIRIEGFLAERINRFNVNLCSDCVNGPIMLHMDVRFNYKTDINVLVRNFYLNGQWKYEERGGIFPFHIREAFILCIEVQREVYNITVNNQHILEYKHRLPFTQVKEMRINTGPVTIWKVELIQNDKKEITNKPYVAGQFSSCSICVSSLYMAVFMSLAFFCS